MGSDFMNHTEATGRSKEVVAQLLDAVYILEAKVKAERNTNDFSGEARLMKSKYEAARRELNQLTKFKENLLGIISGKIKTIYASANSINSSSDDEQVKKLSSAILKPRAGQKPSI